MTLQDRLPGSGRFHAESSTCSAALAPATRFLCSSPIYRVIRVIRVILFGLLEVIILLGTQQGSDGVFVPIEGEIGCWGRVHFQKVHGVIRVSLVGTDVFEQALHTIFNSGNGLQGGWFERRLCWGHTVVLEQEIRNIVRFPDALARVVLDHSAPVVSPFPRPLPSHQHHGLGGGVFRELELLPLRNTRHVVNSSISQPAADVGDVFPVLHQPNSAPFAAACMNVADDAGKLKPRVCVPCAQKHSDATKELINVFVRVAHRQKAHNYLSERASLHEKCQKRKKPFSLVLLRRVVQLQVKRLLLYK